MAKSAISSPTAPEKKATRQKAKVGFKFNNPAAAARAAAALKNKEA